MYDITYCATYNTTGTATMSINRNESFTLKFACHIFIVVFIYALLLLFSTLRIYYLFSSSFKRRKRKLCCLFPIRKKNTTKGCTFQSVMAVVVFFTETSSKPNWTPHIVNWIVTQFTIGGQYGIGFGGRRWSGATRPRPFSKQLTVQKHGMHCIYFCSNSYLRFAASIKRNFP